MRISRIVAVCGLLAVPFAAHAGWLSHGEDGNGKKISETRALSGFTKIANHTFIDMRIHQAKTFAVVVKIDSNIAPLVSTKVEDGTLIIDSKDVGSIHGESVVDIAMPDFHGIQIDGSADATISGFTAANDVAIDIHGSGDVHYAGNAGNVVVAIHGSGNVTFDKGVARRLEAKGFGSGDLHAWKLEVHDAMVAMQGSGDAELTVNGGRIDVEITGSSDVVWRGDAKPGAMISRGSGDIHRG